MTDQTRRASAVDNVFKTVGLWVLALPVVIAGTAGLLALSAFALHSFWGWFVVPLGVPPITMGHAAGLALIPALFKSSDGTGWELVGNVVTKYLVLVTVGWIVHTWWM
jgi:hypothetical protein